jgi:hypothetical protein
MSEHTQDNKEVEKWWKLATTLPCGSSPADQTARKKLFSKFDGNGNGYLSFTEVEKGMKLTLGAAKGDALPCQERCDAPPFRSHHSLSGRCAPRRNNERL